MLILLTASALRRLGRLAALLLTSAGIAAACSASALATGQKGLLVTYVARACPAYTDITANRARNDIQESLRDLGADTPYQPGQEMNPTVEQENQPNCKPLPNWTFTLGTGYRTRAVAGPWGSLSIVTGAFPTPILTHPSTPLLDSKGTPTGRSIAGAVTVALTPEQAAIAARPNSLWVQGGTPMDPILNQPFPGQYGFGALRCAIDDLNGDNVEWVGFPSGVKHVFCFAYYVQPPPTSGTVVVVKHSQAPSGTSESFPFEGNLSFNEGGRFALAPAAGQSAQQTFIRAETLPGEAPWTVRELVPPSWRLTGLQCASSSGGSKTTIDLAQAEAAIYLGSGDTVTCTYTDEPIPPAGGLLIRKLTQGGLGSFPIEVKPVTGGQTSTVTATTLREGEAVDALPGPLSLAPGEYALSETTPQEPGGRWALSSVQCNGSDLPVTQPIHVTIVSGAGTVCTLANTFAPAGSISIEKVTEGGVGTTGFTISPAAGKPFELQQSATTKHPGEPAPAIGEPAHELKLGKYLIQETTPEPAGGGRWELSLVHCNGRDLPFADGQTTVELTAAEHDLHCTFTNIFNPDPPPEPKPPPGVVDPQAKLTVVKQAHAGQVAPGGTVAYTLTVTNHGPEDAEEVVLIDQPVGAATLLSVHPSQGSCTHALPASCKLGLLTVGQSATVAVVLIPDKQGVFVNHEIVGTATLDPTYARDNVSATVDVRRRRHARAPTFTG